MREFVTKPKQRGLPLVLRVTAGGCLLFGLIPSILYGIINEGVLALLAGAMALWALAKWWRDMPKWGRKLATGTLCAGLGLATILSAMMLWKAYAVRPEPGQALPVIVLGGGIEGDQPSLMLARRLHEAQDYLAKTPDAICVVSGGQGPDESFPEAHVMAAYLDGMGVASPRVLQEDSSSNTAENLAFSLELLTSHLGARPQRIVIATDGFHQLRASVYAAQLGVESVSLSASTPWGLVPSYWVREWIGLAAIAVGLR